MSNDETPSKKIAVVRRPMAPMQAMLVLAMLGITIPTPTPKPPTK